jgi:pyruvate-formate lyase-activating enzyme
MIGYLYLDRVCNNRCIFCASTRTVLKIGPEILELRDAGELLREVSCSTGGHYLLISGGEPTVHPNIRQVVSLAKRRFARVALATNAIRLANMRFARSLRDAGVDVIGTPFYSCNPRVHDFVTQHPGSFKLSVKGVHNFEDLGGAVNIKTLVAGFSAKNLVRIYDWAVAEFGEAIHFSLDSLRFGAAVKKSRFTLELCKFRWAGVVPHIRLLVKRALKNRVRFSLERIPLCVFPAAAITPLYRRGAVLGPRDQSVRILPGGKTDLVSPEESEPARIAACSRCDLADICSKCYENCVEYTGFASFARPFILAT